MQTFSYKRPLYIALWIIFGLLVQSIVHAGIEMAYIALLLSDFSAWNFGLSWESLEMVHAFFTAFLIIAGGACGAIAGLFFYSRVYGNKR